jgi:tetratricopeptide (TPR) repeat protein
MAKKKTGQLSISQDAQEQSQEVFEHYNQVVSKVRASTERQAAEAALAEISDLSEAAQFVLLKSLVKEKSLDAADLLLAINELSPQKSVRKEARRALIQLASAKIYPQWKPPVEQPLVSDTQLTNIPRRFWKGIITDTRATGSMQLILAWEQGEDYRDVQMLGFLLDFWDDGVKEFFSQVMSKRSYENTAARIEMSLPGIKWKSSSLARGRRLLLDALAVNRKKGTQPHIEYRRHLSLVNQLILEAPDLDEDVLDSEEEEDEDILDVEDYEDLDDDFEEEDIEYETQDLTPEGVVSTFVQAYFEGKFETSYTLLATDSPLREGLVEEDWAESREGWYNAANPDDLETYILWERPAQKSALWVPNIVSANRRNAEKVIEAGWSIEMDKTSEGEDFPELPRPTAIYRETDRHWFWTSYSLVKEKGQWRIQYMVDEATAALNLPTEELYNKIREKTLIINEITHKHKPTDANSEKYAVEIQRNLFQSTSYIDALLARSYDDRALYREAASRMTIFGFWERSLVYLEELTQRFEENRAADLRAKAAAQQSLSRYFSEQKGDEERSERLLELAEEALRESLTLEDRFETRISLAEVLIGRDVNLDEAEDHLLQAKTMISSTAIGDEAHIEMHLGEIAMQQDRDEEALRHYLRVAELTPDYVDTWADLGVIYGKLNNLEEADASFRRAIAIQPDNIDLYFNLNLIYSERGRGDEGIEILEEGLRANPTSGLLNLYLVTAYLEKDDYRQAEIRLEKAEQLGVDIPMVEMLREVLKERKKTSPAPISFRPGKAKRKHR